MSVLFEEALSVEKGVFKWDDEIKCCWRRCNRAGGVDEARIVRAKASSMPADSARWRREFTGLAL